MDSARDFKLAALGVLNPGLAYALGLLGLVSVSASMSVLLWATEPILILVLAVLVLRERVAAATLAAIAVALVGVGLVIYRPGTAGDAIGVTLTVAAVTACACYTVLTRRWPSMTVPSSWSWSSRAPPSHSPLSLLASRQPRGLRPLACPPTPARGHSQPPPAWSPDGFAFWFFIGGLRGVPASIAGAFLPSISIFGLAAAFLVGDRLLDRQWLGAALVVFAAIVAAVHHLTRATADDDSSALAG